MHRARSASRLPQHPSSYKTAMLRLPSNYTSAGVMNYACSHNSQTIMASIKENLYCRSNVEVCLYTHFLKGIVSYSSGLRVWNSTAQGLRGVQLDGSLSIVVWRKEGCCGGLAAGLALCMEGRLLSKVSLFCSRLPVTCPTEHDDYLL